MPKPPDPPSGGDGFSYDPEVGADWWTMAPTRLLRARGLAPTAKLLYLVLCSYAMQKAEAWPGQDRLILDCDVTKPTLRLAIQRLIAVGLLTQTRRGQGRTNKYHLHKVPVAPEGKNLSFSPEAKNLAIKTASDLPSGEQESMPKEEAPEQQIHKNGSAPAILSGWLYMIATDTASELHLAGDVPGRVLAAWQRSGLDEPAMADRLYQARTAARKARGDKAGAYWAQVEAGK